MEARKKLEKLWNEAEGERKKREEDGNKAEERES